MTVLRAEACNIVPVEKTPTIRRLTNRTRRATGSAALSVPVQLALLSLLRQAQRLMPMTVPTPVDRPEYAVTVVGQTGSDLLAQRFHNLYYA
jgi:hypothetical protein